MVCHGVVELADQVTSYLRRHSVTGDVWDSTPLDLPVHRMTTQAMWWLVPDEVVAELAFSAVRLGAAAHAAEHTAIGLLPAFAPCDRWDIGGLSTVLHPDTNQCTIFVHDGAPGGSGFAERGFQVAEDWCGGHSGAAAGLRLRFGLPDLLCVTEVRQRQPAARQGIRDRTARGAARQLRRPYKFPTGGYEVAPSRHRVRDARIRASLPYLAIAPTLVTFLVLLGYPVWLLLLTSLQHFGIFELLNNVTTWIGLQNYVDILFNSPAGLPDFPTVLLRTTAFMAVCVSLTITLGMLVALLLDKLNKWVRLILSASMILAWAMPTVTGAVLFQWLFDSKLGVVNWAISSLGIFGDYLNHSWFETGLTTFGVCALLIVWQSIPFVALSLYAGILSISKELPEAARVDGANERQIFSNITWPAVRPLLMMLVFLSVIWDFKVFTQVYAMASGGPNGQTITLSVYSYIVGIQESQYGFAASAAVIMMLLLMLVLIPYIRRMIKSQEEM